MLGEAKRAIEAKHTVRLDESRCKIGMLHIAQVMTTVSTLRSAMVDGRCSAEPLAIALADRDAGLHVPP